MRITDGVRRTSVDKLPDLLAPEALELDATGTAAAAGGADLNAVRNAG